MDEPRRRPPVDPFVGERLPNGLCLASVIVNALVCVCYAGGPDLVASVQGVMRPCPAVGLLCHALALLLCGPRVASAPRRALALALSTVTTGAGLGTLLCWAWPSSPPQQMWLVLAAKPLGGVLLVLSGLCGVALARCPGPSPTRLEAAAAPAVAAAALLVALAQAFDAPGIYLWRDSPLLMPLAAYYFFLNGLALLLLRPAGRLMAPLLAADLGGRMARRLLVCGLPATAVLGWLRLWAERAGWAGARESSTWLTFTLLLLFCAFARREAQLLSALDGRRSRSLAALNEAVQARDTFMSMASHELRSPLTSLSMRADLFARRLQRQQPVDLTRFVREVQGSVRQLDRLVDDLLDVARIESGRLQLRQGSMDLGRCVREVCERLAPQLDAAHMDVRCEIGAAPCRGDPHRLEQVFTNLLTNAIRYAPGAPLDVRVGLRDGCAVAEVCDHGPGVDTAAQARIFAPFERGRGGRAPGGLGLGLFIGRQIVAAHGGRLTLASAPGRGAAFAVALPLPTAPRPPP